MNLILRALVRLIVAVAGYIAASIAAGITVVIAVAGWAATALGDSHGMGGAPVVYLGGALGGYIITVAVAPWALIALIGEVFGIRSGFYYVLAGGLTGALGYVGMADIALRAHAAEGFADEFAVVVAAGVVAGAVYWLIAGRSAGILPERGAEDATRSAIARDEES